MGILVNKYKQLKKKEPMDIKLKNTKSEIKIPWINLVVNWILQKKHQ